MSWCLLKQSFLWSPQLLHISSSVLPLIFSVMCIMHTTNNSRSTFTPPTTTPSSSSTLSSTLTITTLPSSQTTTSLDNKTLSQAISRAIADLLPALLSSLQGHVVENRSKASAFLPSTNPYHSSTSSGPWVPLLWSLPFHLPQTCHYWSRALLVGPQAFLSMPPTLEKVFVICQG